MNNIMRKIKIEKVTLNCGTGTSPADLEKGMRLLKIITNQQPVKTKSKKRIPAFGIREGLTIGCKATIRGKNAIELLKRLLGAIDNRLSYKQINPGSFAFGIKEYIEIPGIAYQRDMGIIGLDVCVTLTRPGLRVCKRKISAGRIPKRHRISKEETAQFMRENFNTKIEMEKEMEK